MKEENLPNRIRKWYESYETAPPWSSVLALVVQIRKETKEEMKKENKKEFTREEVYSALGDLIRHLDKEGYQGAHDITKKFTEFLNKN